MSTVSPRNIVLIPAARLVDQEMQMEVGRIPPVLIPINGKPVLELIIERYRRLPGETHFYVAVHEGQDRVAEYLSRREDRDQVQALSIGPTEDLGQTVDRALSLISGPLEGNLYIHFGDTLIEGDLEQGADAVFYDMVPESYRWTTFRVEQEKLLIADRFTSDSENEQAVFAGVFLVRDPSRFLASLRSARGTPELGRFYVALLGYFGSALPELVRVSDWSDVGHVDNYFFSKKKFINRRFFNQIKVDQYRAVLEKRSQHYQKFYGEIKWYLEMPASLRCYLPQVYDYSLCGEESFLKLEYYGYPPLSDLYNGGHSLSTWNHVFEAVFRLLSEMAAYRVKMGREHVAAAMHAMYVGKTMERLRMLSADPLFEPFFCDTISINGQNYPSLWEMVEPLPGIVDSVLVEGFSEMSVIHGDLCLSNILFDPRSRIIKLVDPRGQFGSQTVYGDFRYDLAKLSHSFHGFYELILADGFELQQSRADISFRVLASEQQFALRQKFEQRLEDDFSEHISGIRLVEALLFLSMVPLHRDTPRRQFAMLATGVEQFCRAVKQAEQK